MAGKIVRTIPADTRSEEVNLSCAEGTAGSVLIEAPARLHLGFVDLAGSLGRRFGSLGLAIERFGVRVTVAPASSLHVAGLETERAAKYVRAVTQGFGLPTNFALAVEACIPPHAGLGSGTQLALAIGRAIAAFHQLNVTTAQLSTLLDRGARSGVGVGAFESGGFILDGGKGTADTPPPILSRMAFPESWRIIVVTDDVCEGVHGSAELAAFRKLPAFPDALAERLARLTLMQILPALAEQQFEPFANGITELQAVVGRHFAAAQGGEYTSARVERVVRFLHAYGALGIGQSSWGPTAFALCESEEQAGWLVRTALQAELVPAGVQLNIVAARNHGAQLTIDGVQKPAAERIAPPLPASH